MRHDNALLLQRWSELKNFVNLRLPDVDRFAPWKGEKIIAPGKRRGGGPVAQPGVQGANGVSPGRATDISVALPGLVHCWHSIPRAALRLPGAIVSGPFGASQSLPPSRGLPHATRYAGGK